MGVKSLVFGKLAFLTRDLFASIIQGKTIADRRLILLWKPITQTSSHELFKKSIVGLLGGGLFICYSPAVERAL